MYIVRALRRRARPFSIGTMMNGQSLTSRLLGDRLLPATPAAARAPLTWQFITAQTARCVMVVVERRTCVRRGPLLLLIIMTTTAAPSSRVSHLLISLISYKRRSRHLPLPPSVSAVSSFHLAEFTDFAAKLMAHSTPTTASSLHRTKVV